MKKSFGTTVARKMPREVKYIEIMADNGQVTKVTITCTDNLTLNAKNCQEMMVLDAKIAKRVMPIEVDAIEYSKCFDTPITLYYLTKHQGYTVSTQTGSILFTLDTEGTYHILSRYFDKHYDFKNLETVVSNIMNAMTVPSVEHSDLSFNFNLTTRKVDYTYLDRENHCFKRYATIINEDGTLGEFKRANY